MEIKGIKSMLFDPVQAKNAVEFLNPSPLSKVIKRFCSKEEYTKYIDYLKVCGSSVVVRLSASYSPISAGLEISNKTKNSVEQNYNIKMTYYSELECIEKPMLHFTFDV